MSALAPADILAPCDRVIRVRVFHDPIAGLHIDVTVPWGSTIAEIVATIPLMPEHEPRRPHFAARLGEHEVPRDRWQRVRPAAFAACRPVTLIIYLPLHGPHHGGGIARKLLSIVAAVALIGLTSFIGGGGLGFLGSFFQSGALGARILAGAVAIGGALLLQGLFKPPGPPPQDSQDAIEQASAPNTYQPGAQLQRVIGLCKVAPIQVIAPFTSIDDGTVRADGTYRYGQWVTTCYALAGQHRIEKVYIGDVDASEMKDVDIEILPGTATDPHLTLITDTRVESQVGLSLSEWQVDPDQGADGAINIDGTIAEAQPLWHIVETRQAPDAFRIEFLMPSGLYHRDNNASAAFAIRLQMRSVVGDGWSDWSDLGSLLIQALEPNDALRLHLEIQWVDSYPATSGNAWPPVAIGTPVKGFYYLWTADAYTTGGAGVTGWSYESPKRVYLYLLKAAWPQGRYQFQVQRSYPFDSSSFVVSGSMVAGAAREIWNPTADNGAGGYNLPTNPGHYASDIVITTVQSRWNDYPIADDGEAVTLIAVRARNRQLQTISVIATGCCDDWDGTSWIAGQPTTNPASWYRHVLRDSHNAEPVDDSLIDLPAMQDWHEWCDGQGLSIGAVVQGKSVIDTLKLIALVGWASPVFGAQFSVVPERARPSPVGMITQRNAVKFGMRKPFSPEVHALRVTYLDGSYLFVPREIIVYAPGFGPSAGGGLQLATRYEAVTYDGINSESAARDRATLDIKWALNRSTLLTFTMDIEHLEFRRGDLVLMETDILGQWGGRGRVKSVTLNGAGKIVSLELDEYTDFGGASGDLWTIGDLTTVNDLWAARGAAGATIRCADGSLVTAAATVNDGATTLVFASPVDMPTSHGEALIDVGALVVTGSLGRTAREVLVWDIAPGQDLTADITCVDYAPDIFYGA
jgi:hypothetical protein